MTVFTRNIQVGCGSVNDQGTTSAIKSALNPSNLSRFAFVALEPHQLGALTGGAVAWGDLPAILTSLDAQSAHEYLATL